VGKRTACKEAEDGEWDGACTAGHFAVVEEEREREREMGVYICGGGGVSSVRVGLARVVKRVRSGSWGEISDMD
jgi:hypothetical protein